MTGDFSRSRATPISDHDLPDHGIAAARDAGIHVPDEIRTKCIHYVKNSQNADGGFRYHVRAAVAAFPLTQPGGVAGMPRIYEGGGGREGGSSGS